MDINDSTLFSVVNIILVDIFLGGDNAVVIALACHRLPQKSRNKAILFGTFLAVLLRITLTAIMLSLLQIPYLLSIGGLFLVYIAYKLVSDKPEESQIKAGTTFIQAVRIIVFADLVMGLDNILGIAGAAKGNLFLVIFGLSISVPIIIWGSKLILVAMDHFPGLIYIGSAILAFTASNMIAEEPKFYTFFHGHPHYKSIITTTLIIGVIFIGLFRNHRKSTTAF